MFCVQRADERRPGAAQTSRDGLVHLLIDTFSGCVPLGLILQDQTGSIRLV